MLDCTNKFGKVINEIDDIAVAARKCNKIHEDSTKEVVDSLLDWLLYDDDVFDAWGRAKISSREVYNRFLDEMKI